MSDVLLIVTLAAHLLCVALAGIGPVYCMWLEWRLSAGGPEVSGLIGRRLAHVTLAAFGVGAVLGLAAGGQLWLAGDSAFFDALRRLGSRIWFGVAELGFFLACMMVYAVTWPHGPGRRPLAAWGHRLLAIAAATNLLYHFPVLFAIARWLATGVGLEELGLAAAASAPQAEAAVLDSADFRRLMMSGNVFSGAVHFWFASAIVGAVAVMLLASRRIAAAQDVQAAASESGQPKSSEPCSQEAAACQRIVRQAAGVGAVAAFLQFPIGMWVASQLPAPVQTALLGGSWLSTGLLAAGVLAALALMQRLAAVVLGDAAYKDTVYSGVLTALVILLMTAVSQSLR